MNLWWMEFFLSKIHPALGCCVFFFFDWKKATETKKLWNCLTGRDFFFFVVEKFYQIISTPIHWHSVRNFSCIGFKTNTFQSVRRSKLVIGWKNWKENKQNRPFSALTLKLIETDHTKPARTDVGIPDGFQSRGSFFSFGIDKMAKMLTLRRNWFIAVAFRDYLAEID